jgi:hypothetical protein
MTLFDQQWNEMKASPSGGVEAERLDSLVEFARSHGVKYTVSLADAATGKPIPIAALADSPPRALRVRVAIDDKGKDPPSGMGTSRPRERHAFAAGVTGHPARPPFPGG